MTAQELEGLVIASYGARGRLDTGDGTPARFVLKGRRLRAVCGDRVRYRPQDTSPELLVTEIIERQNLLERPDARGRPEPLAANLTRLVVVLAAEPEPDFFIADRYLCAAEMMGAEAQVLWNKTDIAMDRPAALSLYEQLGYSVIDTSATEGAGIDQLTADLSSGIAMLVGQSGVGKSSLINMLIKDAEVATGELSESSKEGRHTTTASFMHTLPGGGRLVDSPGVREFAPVIADPASVQTGFRELVRFAPDCRFSNCQHLREPNCAVKAAVAEQQIDERRYESYKRLRNQAESFYRKQND